MHDMKEGIPDRKLWPFHTRLLLSIPVLSKSASKLRLNPNILHWNTETNNYFLLFTLSRKCLFSLSINHEISDEPLIEKLLTLVQMPNLKFKTSILFNRRKCLGWNNRDWRNKTEGRAMEASSSKCARKQNNKIVFSRTKKAICLHWIFKFSKKLAGYMQTICFIWKLRRLFSSRFVATVYLPGGVDWEELGYSLYIQK